VKEYQMKRSTSGLAILKAGLLCWMLGTLGIAGERHVKPDNFETTSAPKGRVAVIQVHGKSLENNPLGIQPQRDVYVYLPASYDTTPDKRYPVIYCLHGNNSGRKWPLLIQEAADNTMGQGKAKEMIIVTPIASTIKSSNSGSHYVNSVLTGKWEDFITKDLIEHIDANFRTIPHRNSRGVGGYSMGGRGSLSLAMKYPELYSAVFGMSSGVMDFEGTKGEFTVNDDNEAWAQLLEWAYGSNGGQGRMPLGYSSRLLCFARAYSPNLDRPPLFVDLPFELREGKLARIDAVWKRWLFFDPVAIAKLSQKNLLRLKAIEFDCGNEDSCFHGNVELSRVLTEMKIPHHFHRFEGGHMDNRIERVESKLLPFFTKHLDFSLYPPVEVDADD